MTEKGSWNALLERLLGHLEVVSVRRREVIFRQGETAETLFFVRRGKVLLTQLSASGKEAVIQVLGEGDFCGESCIVDTRNPVTASALTDAELIKVSRSQFHTLLERTPEVGRQFTASLIRYQTSYQERLASAICEDSEHRLAHTLLYLSNFGTPLEESGAVALPRVSQELLAEMAGTTRSRVSVLINKFRKLGLLQDGRELRVVPFKLNAYLAKSLPAGRREPPAAKAPAAAAMKPRSGKGTPS